MTEDRLAAELDAIAGSTPSGVPHDYSELRRVMALLPGASPTSPVGGAPPVLPATSSDGTGDGSQVMVRDGSVATAGSSSDGSTPAPVVEVIHTVYQPPPTAQQVLGSRIGSIPGIVIAPSSLPGISLAPGAISDITKFAASIRPPVVVAVLPTLPDAAYPQGSFAYLTTDLSLYRTNDGNSWDKAVGANDIIAGSITAGQIAAGAIGAGQIAAGAITADKLAATLILASTLVAGAAGAARVEIDTGGIRAYAADGLTLMAYLPTNGDPFSFNGSVVASSLSSYSAMLAGTTVVPGTSGILVAPGATDPTTPAILTSPIDSVALYVSPVGHGLAYDAAGDSDGATATVWTGSDPVVSDAIAHEFNAATGQLLRTLSRHNVAAGSAALGISWRTATTAGSVSGVDRIVGEMSDTRPTVGTRLTAIYLSTNGWTGRARPVVIGTIDGQMVLLYEGADYTSGGNSYTNYTVDCVVPANCSSVVVGLLIADSTTTIGFQRQIGAVTTGVYDRANDIVTAAPACRFNVSWSGRVETADEGSVGRTVGVCRQGSYIWTLDAGGILYKFNQSNLTFIAKYDMSANITGISPRAGLYFDGTNLVITTTTWATGPGYAKLVKVTTGGAYSSSLSCTGLMLSSTLTATVRGGYDDATNVWLAITDATYTGVYAFNRTTGANVANRDFGAVAEIGSGVTWDGSVFLGMRRGTAKVWQFTSWDWSTATQPFWIGYTWRQAAGPYETKLGGIASISMGRRRKMSVTTPTLLPPADQVRVYAAQQAASPAYTDVHLQTTDALTGRNLTSYNSGSANSPASNNFPATNPGSITDVSSKWFMLGDGRSAFTVDGGIYGGAQASVASSATANILLPTNVQQNPSNLHFTSSANLTGTLAKTAGNSGIVGTGTSFTTELAIGQVVQIPGTTTEWFIVTAIADNTHFTAHRTATSSASGQYGVRLNHAIAIPSGYAGWWRIEASMGYPSVTASTTNEINLTFNKTTDGVTSTVIGGGGNYAQASSGNMAYGAGEAVLAAYDILYGQFTNKTGGAITPTLAFLSVRRVSL